MATLETTFAGLKLRNPIIVSSSGLTDSAAKNQKLSEAGAGAIVLKSLFEEQIMMEADWLGDPNMYPEGSDYLVGYIREHKLGEYLNLIKESKKVCNIPIIASINCYQNADWVEFAAKIEEAGADALEINILALQTDVQYTYGTFEQRHIDILSHIKKTVKIPVIMKLGDNTAMQVDAISTGSLGLDLALGVGGVPRGRIIEVFGPESSGKTTLALHILAEAQKKGGEVAFIDVEHALEPAYARALGVDIDSLLISQPDTGEQALDITESLVRSSAVDVVVVDSVAALIPRIELEGEMGDSVVGALARLMSQAMRRLAGCISKNGCTVIFINQLRQKIGVMYGNPETTPGGLALKYYASVRIDVRRIETLKVGGEMIGNRTRAKVIKNKCAPPFKEAEFDIMYGEGISKVGEIVDLGVKLEIIDKAGAWFTVGEQRIQGRDAVKEYLLCNPEVCANIEQQIRENAYKLMSPQARKAAQAAGRAIDVSADDFEG